MSYSVKGAVRNCIQIVSSVIVQSSSETSLVEFGGIVIDVIFRQPRGQRIWSF